MNDQTTTPPTGAVAGRWRLPRRRFLSRALGIGAGALGLSATAGARNARAQQPAVNDPAILNFALNLEYLEAEYYTFATTGNSIEALGLPTTGTNTGAGDPGPITIKADPKVPFASATVMQYANEVAIDERKHVNFIRTTLADLDATPVARPAIDLLNSFNTLAEAAGLPTPFDPFANDLNFLLGAYIFEDVGVSAYHGAAPLIQSTAVLSGAAGILGTEAYHSGLIRTILFQEGEGTATEAISMVRLMLGGSVDYGVAQGPLDDGPAGSASVILGDQNASAASRTTRQVLNIVYGGVNAKSGLFFPLGLNGTIR